jgi:hypothetical protein
MPQFAPWNLLLTFSFLVVAAPVLAPLESLSLESWLHPHINCHLPTSLPSASFMHGRPKLRTSLLALADDSLTMHASVATSDGWTDICPVGKAFVAAKCFNSLPHMSGRPASQPGPSHALSSHSGLGKCGAFGCSSQWRLAGAGCLAPEQRPLLWVGCSAALRR